MRVCLQHEVEQAALITDRYTYVRYIHVPQVH